MNIFEIFPNISQIFSDFFKKFLFFNLEILKSFNRSINFLKILINI